MSGVLGILEAAKILEGVASASGAAKGTAVAIERLSAPMSRVFHQKRMWVQEDLDVLPKWARIASKNDFSAKMSGESMEHWRTRVFQPDLTPTMPNEVKIPHFYRHPYGIEVESHQITEIPARVYESAKQSILRVDALSLFGEGSGSIVNMGREKVLATNTHVLEAFKKPTDAIVNFADGTFARVKEVRMGSYPDNDIALMFVDKDLTGYPALKLGESKSLLPRERLYSLGHPAGAKTVTMSSGNLEHLDSSVMIHRDEIPIGLQSGTIRTNMRAVGGQSGAPVLRWNEAEKEAEMVGIHSTANNVGSNAVTSEDLLKFVERWRPEAISAPKVFAENLHGHVERLADGTRVVTV